MKPVLSKRTLRKAKKWLLKTGESLIKVNLHLFGFKGTKNVSS